MSKRREKMKTAIFAAPAIVATSLIFSAGVPATAEAEPTEEYKECYKEEYEECMKLVNDLPWCLVNARLMCRPNSAGGGASAAGSFTAHQGGGGPLGKPAKPGKHLSGKLGHDQSATKSRFQGRLKD